jgi:glycosyltransferase involved in cell wall biosynthesis
MLPLKIRFTVLIPLYNKGQHILDTLASVQAQSHPAAEILVIDDGSSDGGADLVAEQNIAGVKIIRQHNGGVSKARNRGYALAKHDYIALLDADDSWSPLYLEEMAEAICRLPNAGLYASSYQYRDGEDQFCDAKVRGLSKRREVGLLDNYFAVAAQGDLPFISSSVCLNRAVLQDRFSFPEGEVMGEDQAVWSQVALYSSIVYNPRILVLYQRCADNRACVNHVPLKECPFSQRLTQLSSEHMLGEALEADILKYSAAHLVAIAKLNIQRGKLDSAWLLLKDARCWKKPIHKLWWTAMCWIYRFRSC